MTEVPIAATENRDVDWVDVTGWGVFDGHAIPVAVARKIAERINLYHEYRPVEATIGHTHESVKYVRADKLTELEAENARLVKERDDLQNRHDSLEHALDGIKSRSEALPRTGAVKVKDDLLRRVRDFIDEERDRCPDQEHPNDREGVKERNEMRPQLIAELNAARLSVLEPDATHAGIASVEPATPEGRQEAVAWQNIETPSSILTPEQYAMRLPHLAHCYRPLYTRPTEQAVTEAMVERKFRLGDRVTKIKGSSWTGRVVGFYSTSLTPVGYDVESENEPGSVQLYPEVALQIAP